MKKKLLSVVLTAVMAASVLTGCGSTDNGTAATGAAQSEAGASTNAAATDGKVYNIGICQLVEHEALDAATQGFQDALKEKLGDNVTFDLQNLIPGFVEAVTNMKVGQECYVYIHPDYGYGEQNTGTIPPQSLLVFRIYLKGIATPEVTE